MLWRLQCYFYGRWLKLPNITIIMYVPFVSSFNFLLNVFKVNFFRPQSMCLVWQLLGWLQQFESHLLQLLESLYRLMLLEITIWLVYTLIRFKFWFWPQFSLLVLKWYNLTFKVGFNLIPNFKILYFYLQFLLFC